MRATLLIVLCISLAVLPACQMNERLSGTLMGGVGGGAIGAAVGGFGGAVIGVLGGGLAGYLVGDYIADRRERGRAEVFSGGGQPVAQTYPHGSSQPTGYTTRQSVAGIKQRAPGYAATSQASRAAYQRGRAALTAPEARVHFEEATRLAPYSPEAYNALALNALYRGDASEADRYFRKSLEVDPNYQPARFNYERFQRKGLQTR